MDKPIQSKEFLSIASQSGFSDFLLSMWEKSHNCTSIITQARTTMRRKNVSNIFLRILYFAFAAGFSEILLEGIAHIAVHDLFIGITLAAMGVCIIGWQYTEYRVNGTFFSFAIDIDILANRMNVSRKDLFFLSEKELQRRVSEIMVNKALDMLELEDENKDVPSIHFSHSKEQLASNFSWCYSTFDRFGLVHGGYGPYYRAAREALSRLKNQ